MSQIITKLLGVICVLLFLSGGSSLMAQQDSYPSGKSLFSGIRARHIGPALTGGRVTDIELHPENSRIIYIGSAGGGVWKSMDGGLNFAPVFDEYAQSIGCVKVDRNDPDHTVWVGTGETWTRNSTSIGDGIYKSTDGGNTWKNMGLEHSERISSILIKPGDSQTIFAGVLGALWSDSPNRGVYKSTDGGKHWDKIFYLNDHTGCSELVMDPEHPEVLYAAFWDFRRTPWSFRSGGPGSGLYKSTDEGKTWKKIHNGFPDGDLGRIAFAVAPSDANRLYAVLETGDSKSSGLWRSDDAGGHWKHLNGDFGLVVRPFYFSRIVVDPRDKNILAKAGLNTSLSRDGGETFKSLGMVHSDIHDIAFGIHDSDLMYVVTDGGVYHSHDGGGSFEMVENLPLAQYYHVSVDNEEPYHIYGGLQDNGSWYVSSESYGGISAKDWHPVGYGDGFRVFKHPEKNIIYTEMQGAANIWRYDMDNKRITTIQPLEEKGDPKLRFNWNAAITISHHHPDRLYVGSQFLHRSDNRGDSWEKISPDLTTNDPDKQRQDESGGLSRDNSGAENHCTIYTIGESPLDENLLWIGTDDGQIQLSRNGGKKWKNLTRKIQHLPAGTWCSHIEPGRHDKGTAYAVFDGHTLGDNKVYVYKTLDYGKTWQNIAGNAQVKGPARCLVEDPQNPQVLYLGTEFGLYITLDAGEHWLKFDNNMPAVAIHSMVIQEKSDDLVMGTHGRGIIILDDLDLIRQITSEVLDKAFHAFPVSAVTMKENNGFSHYFGKETQFIGENPSNAVKIAYYLKKKHIFGKMLMHIEDTEGNVILNLTPGKSKGINVVRWYFRAKPPKVPVGKTFAMGGFTGPRVNAGHYKAVLVKGKDRYEFPFELRYENNGIPIEDRKEQERVTHLLFDKVQELAYFVYRLDNRISFIHTYLKDHKDKQSADLLGELEELKKSLVITTGDNYVNRAEPQLREKLLELYAGIATEYEKPSPTRVKNMEVLLQRFNNAVDTYNGLIEKYWKPTWEKAFGVYSEKSFEEYIK